MKLPLTLALCAAAIVLATGNVSADGKKETKVIGSDKQTGGPTPRDYSRMNDIKSGTQSLQDRVNAERQQRNQQGKK